jgi:hypothetical protein
MSSRWSFALALCLGVLVFSHADADHHKKKHKDKSAELTQCSIQNSKGGMGCVAPLKRVCEKLKNGQSCCACVGDKNAQAPDKDVLSPPYQYCCTILLPDSLGHGVDVCKDDRTKAEDAANHLAKTLPNRTGISCYAECHDAKGQPKRC